MDCVKSFGDSGRLIEESRMMKQLGWASKVTSQRVLSYSALGLLSNMSRDKIRVKLNSKVPGIKRASFDS